MTEKPLVSVIINCFNGERYLRDALNSIINQTYQNWEIIFWDNLSTDKSAEIFKSYKDLRFKYYCATSHSKILYKAKNLALKKARGDFIAFLDVDDWWMSHKLEVQIPLFKDTKVGLVYGNVLRFFTRENKKIIYRKKLPAGNIKKELIDDYVIGSASYVIRKKTLQSLDYLFDNRLHIIGDFDLNIRIASNWRIECIQEPIAVYRIHDKNESILKKNIEVQELKIWYDEMKKKSTFLNDKELKKISIKISYLEIMKTILEEDFRKSLSLIIKYPLSFFKIKLIAFLFLPQFIKKNFKYKI